MAGSIERRADGSLALFINNDLQFDSNDERIYHEALALPALAIAQQRKQDDLHVLVIGGGDGLIARELFKSSNIASVDLVDYDPDILALAKQEFAEINATSLNDSRLKIHVQDAWEYVNQALQSDIRYDLIISDLTVADNVISARFHSVEWYSKLRHLSGDTGILSVNGCSPQATPQAYWSIFNGMVKGGLHARPYHMEIPSFKARGYGDDWGFFLASVQPITQNELDADLALAQPRFFLKDIETLKVLFEFPEELFQHQSQSLPALIGSDILLHYFRNSDGLVAGSGTMRSAFTLDCNNIVVPEPDDGKGVLPPELNAVVANAVNPAPGSTKAAIDAVTTADAQMYLHGILELMPSLQPDQTAEIVQEFLEDPSVFLQAIDLPGLVSRLLRRAVELPFQLVSELEMLRDKLHEWAGDHLSLLTLGRRVVTILTLVIVVGNLLYPDSVYGKGHGGAGYGGWNGGYTNTYYYNRRPIIKKQIMPGAPRNTVRTKGLNQSSIQRKEQTLSAFEFIDETGTAYPVHRYHLHPEYAQGQAVGENQIAAGELSAIYKLGPKADVLPTGHLAMPLTNHAYLMMTAHAMHMIDQESGMSIMALKNDTVLAGIMAREINRQHAHLLNIMTESNKTGGSDIAQANQENRLQLQRLEVITNYLQALGQTMNDITGDSVSKIQQTEQAASDAVNIFPGVSITTDGDYILVKRMDDNAYIDEKGWYREPGGSPINEPYPLKFKQVIISYLSKMVRDEALTKEMLLQDRIDLFDHLEMLKKEINACEESASLYVKFGSREVPQEEALRQLHLATSKTKARVESLNKHIEDLPANVNLAMTMLANLSDDRNV